MDSTPRRFYLGNVFDDFLAASNQYLKSDVYEQENNYVIEMDVPGVSKDAINIESQNGYLTVGVSNEETQEDESKNYIRRERNYSEYSRQFYLGNIDSDNIKAEYKNGILKVMAPKLEETPKNKKIQIQ